jgi:ankyrin repeat protein
MEMDVEVVLGEHGLADAAAVLRSRGVNNLETMQAMAGEDVDLDRLLLLGFPFATAKVFISKRAKVIASLEYRVRVRKEQDNQRLFEAAHEYLTTADSFKKMRELIQTGSHPDGYKNKDGWTALIWASCNGHAEVVKFLLSNGANPDVQGYDGWSALLWASHNGYAQVAVMLLDHGADTDLQGESGGTALTRASDKGHVDIVRELLTRGASTDTQNALGYTALMWACARGHLQVVKMLLEKGARAELRNVDSETALVEASRKGT